MHQIRSKGEVTLMALRTGFNMTASDARNVLEKNARQNNGVRTWQALFGGASLAANTQSDALLANYTDTIAQAYKSNLAQQNAIAGAGLNAGATNRLMDLNKQDLHNAYLSYVQNYQQNASAIAENYSKSINEINTELNTQAENTAKLWNSAYGYLSNELQYSDYIRDGKGNVIDEYAWMFDTDEKSPTYGQLKSFDTLVRQGALFDDNAAITTEGQKFFDMMYNAQPQEKAYADKEGNTRFTKTFDEWLSDANPELREWMASGDPYNYTKAGSNLGTAKQLLGLESDDQEYHKSEYADSGVKEYQPITLDDVKGDVNKFVEQNVEKFKSTFKNEAYTKEVSEQLYGDEGAINKYDDAQKEYKIVEKEYKDSIKHRSMLVEQMANGRLGDEWKKYFVKDKRTGSYVLDKNMTTEFYTKLYEKFPELKDIETKYMTAKENLANSKSNVENTMNKIFKKAADKPKKKSGL